ncbi:MAG: MerR family transcriptional regulator [Acetatifactor sp.]|nr:MerR family transcriptional regulator [Acetatifactor sp.]
MSQYLLISDAAKEVKVESHVLRYWEEELHLPIKRNELGHRYYTEEDVERFKQIKGMKERGLQLKAIKMILKDGRLDVLPQEDGDRVGEQIVQEKMDKPKEVEESSQMAINIVASRPADPEVIPEDREEKSKRLQWLLQQLIRETLQENNQELCREIRESVVKELDYQFRVQEEREEERDRRQEQRSEEYYKKMDELLRSKSASRKLKRAAKKEKKVETSVVEKGKEKKPIDMKTHKKKRHFIF